MKVFLSWSGDRSKEIAEALKSWLPQVIQATEPWISSDIEKGTRWSPKIADELEKSKIGIICLTRENLNENWILFEAGALSKTKDAHVCTFLFDLKPSDIEHPLAQFQHTKFEKEDIRKLMHTINQALKRTSERPLLEKSLDRIFDKFWPELNEKLVEIAKNLPKKDQESRTAQDILEEILETVRRQERERRRELQEKELSELLRKESKERELKDLKFAVSEVCKEFEKMLREAREKQKKKKKSKDEKSIEEE